MKYLTLLISMLLLSISSSLFASGVCKPIKNNDGNIRTIVYDSFENTIFKGNLTPSNDKMAKNGILVPRSVIQGIRKSKGIVNGKRVRIKVPTIKTERKTAGIQYTVTNNLGTPLVNAGTCRSRTVVLFVYGSGKNTPPTIIDASITIQGDTPVYTNLGN